MVDIEKNQLPLKQLCELLKNPAVLDAFLEMLECKKRSDEFEAKEKTNTSSLDFMVKMMDIALDQKIQKLRYLLKEYKTLRLKAITFIAKERPSICINQALENLERHLGLEKTDKPVQRLNTKNTTLNKMVSLENKTVLKR